MNTLLENALENICECFKAELKERKEAIVEAYRIVELLNSTVLNVANVQFKKPIKIKWIDDDMETYDDEITNVYNCGSLEYGVTPIKHTEDIPIEYLTLDSLRLVRKEMKFGLWDVCPLDSDDDFHLVSYERFREMSSEEHESRYAYHTQKSL